MTEKLKVIYMGTPDFAVPPLKRLIADGYDVRLVVLSRSFGTIEWILYITGNSKSATV